MEEEKKRKGGILIITLLTLSIVFFTTAAYIFHTADVSEALYYSPEWFMEHSQARKPPQLHINITPPTQLPLPEYFYEIDGKVPNLAWRMNVLSDYKEREGWTAGNNTFEPYSEKVHGNISYIVRTPYIPTSYTTGYPLVGLWDNIEGISCSNFEVYSTTLSRFSWNISRCVPDDYLLVSIYTAEQGAIGIMYMAYYEPKDYLSLARTTASIAETRDMANESDVLKYYTVLPFNYTNKYPEIQDMLNEVRLNDSSTVYEQICSILDYMYSNFVIDETFESKRDPVADAIANKTTPLIGFVNITAVMLRALGIPCRVVVGFVGGTYEPSMDRTILSLQHGYAWIEVWDANNQWVPYDVLPYPSLAENLVPIVTVNLEVPRYLSDLPATYTNESFTINVLLHGVNFTSHAGENVSFYDLNESIEIGISTLVKIDHETVMASITIKYEDIYVAMGRDPQYGVHVIEIRFMAIGIYVKIVLLRPTSIR